MKRRKPRLSVVADRSGDPGNVWGFAEIDGDDPEDLAEAAREASIERRFVQSVPLQWLGRVGVAPYSVRVALAIKLQVDTRKVEPVRIPAWLWDALRLPRGARNTRRHALDALERAGVIRTKRSPGKPTLIWLIDKP